MKKILQSRAFQILIAFFVGGLAATFILPEKVVVKKEKQIEYVDRVVEKEVVKWKDKVVEKEKVIYASEKKVKRKETFPDGHIIEEEVFESNIEQLDRILKKEKEKYEELLSKKEKQFNEHVSDLKVHLNPKNFNIYGGMGTVIDQVYDKYFLGELKVLTAKTNNTEFLKRVNKNMDNLTLQMLADNIEPTDENKKVYLNRLIQPEHGEPYFKYDLVIPYEDLFYNTEKVKQSIWETFGIVIKSNWLDAYREQYEAYNQSA